MLISEFRKKFTWESRSSSNNSGSSAASIINKYRLSQSSRVSYSTESSTTISDPKHPFVSESRKSGNTSGSEHSSAEDEVTENATSSESKISSSIRSSFLNESSLAANNRKTRDELRIRIAAELKNLQTTLFSTAKPG